MCVCVCVCVCDTFLNVRILSWYFTSCALECVNACMNVYMESNCDY